MKVSVKKRCDDDGVGSVVECGMRINTQIISKRMDGKRIHLLNTNPRVKKVDTSQTKSDVSMSGTVGTSTVTFRRNKVYTARWPQTRLHLG